MSFTNQSSKKITVAAGGTTFPYDFLIYNSSHLGVYIDGVLQTTGFTVDGVGNATGGNVTFSVAPTAGKIITCNLEVPFTQELDYSSVTKFPASSHEIGLDLNTMLSKRVNEVNSRTIKFPLDALSTEDPTLPNATQRKGNYLFFDATNGNPVVAAAVTPGVLAVSAFIQTLLDDSTAAIARTTLDAQQKNVIPTGAAPLDSPAFTGSPSFPSNTTGVTQAPGDNTTKYATDAFVQQEIVIRPRIPVRQTVLTGSVDANGLANWLVNGTGLTVDYNATATPVVIAAANGYDDSGEVDQTCRLTTNQTNKFGAMSANVTNFLYADQLTRASITGGNSPIPPQYSDVYDRTQNALLHFDGADAATSTLDEYGNTWTLVANAQLDTAFQKFGTASLLLDGTGDYAECVPSLPFTFTQQGYGWTIEGYYRYNALPGAATTMNLWNFGQSATNFGILLGLNNTTGTLKLSLSLSSNGTSADIASLSLGTSTTWATGTQYHIALVYDPIQGKYFLYKDGVLDNTITSALQVCQIIKARLGETIDATLGQHNGWIDEVRLSPCVRFPNGTTFTPAGSAYTVEGHWFSISEMKMYEATSGSGSAGTNPGFTNRATRVFCGEALASAASMTSTTAYAYRGRYTSIDTAVPAAGTRVAFNANLGFMVMPSAIAAGVRNYTSESNYSPGMTKTWESAQAGFAMPVAMTSESRTVLSVTPNSVTTINLINRLTGASAAGTAANWKFFLSVTRGW